MHPFKVGDRVKLVGRFGTLRDQVGEICLVTPEHVHVKVMGMELVISDPAEDLELRAPAAEKIAALVTELRMELNHPYSAVHVEPDRSVVWLDRRDFLRVFGTDQYRVLRTSERPGIVLVGAAHGVTFKARGVPADLPATENLTEELPATVEQEA
jgi:hypothetical protein